MLSRSSVHAVRALVTLAQLPPGTYSGAGQLAKEIGAPPNYLGKLLQQLARHGLVQSQKGLGGGFCLAREPADIALLDIVDPIEHVSQSAHCLLGLPTCNEEHPCCLGQRWRPVHESYMAVLRETTVASLMPGH